MSAREIMRAMLAELRAIDPRLRALGGVGSPRHITRHPFMNDPKFQPPGGAHSAGHPPRGPRWKRMHHRPFFWVAAFFILTAMVIYVMTDNLALTPGGRAQKAVPAVAP